MGHHETRQKPQSAAHPSNAVALDTTEAGPPRLYAPGKPQEVESGPSRLQTQALGRHQAPDIMPKPWLNTSERPPAAMALRWRSS